MQNGQANRATAPTSSTLMRALRIGLMALPSVLIVITFLRQPDKSGKLLLVGVVCQVLASIGCILNRKNYRYPLGWSVMVLYLTALGCLWIGSANANDWFSQLAQALLMIVPLLFFGVYIVRGSGAPALRHSRSLAQRLAKRREWPKDIAAWRGVPEVKAFRESLQIDADPALELLGRSSRDVQIAALMALEFRKDWRPGQAERIFEMAQKTEDPGFRQAALYALGNVDKLSLIEALAEFFRDPNLEVRKAAREALLWDLEQRWRFLHIPIRRAMADPVCFEDGPMKLEGHLLPSEAISDLMAWVTEGGIVAHRATQTLYVHYAQLLSDKPNKTDLNILHFLVADSHTSPILRLELARLLQEFNEMDINLLERLLDQSQPASLRLFAVKALLSQGPHAEALIALKELARLPNREIALATAEVVQGVLGADMGLPLNQPLPPLHSRQAAEIARHVLAWSKQAESDEKKDDSNLILTRRVNSAGT